MIFNKSKFNDHWSTRVLSDLGTFQRGKSRHRPRNDKALFENGIYPLVQTGEVKAANLCINSHTDTYNDFGLAQSKMWPEGTLAITIAANIAETAILGYPMCFPDSVVGFNADKESSSELYMHYVFTYIREAIQNSVAGSIQDNINIDYLTGLKFKVPEKNEQDRIAKTLSTLDAKIELNNRINAELEAMAKLLYDYWFVQFDFPCLPSDYKPLGAGKLACHDGDSPVDIEAACNYRAVGGLPIPEKGKHFVYVLLCSDDSFYIGMTDDLYRRWHQHKTGQGAKWTKANSPVKVIHHEVFDSRSAASEREKELKTGFGRKWLKREYEKLSKPEGSPTHQSKHAKAGSPAHQSKLMQAGPMTYNQTLKREIPEGWEDATLEDIEPNIITGKTPPTSDTENFGGDIPFICIGDVRGNMHVVETELTLSSKGAKLQKSKFIPKGAICVTCIASPGLVAFATEDSQTNQQLNSVVCKNEENKNYLYFYLTDYFKHAKGAKTGNTFANMNKGDFSSIKVIHPRRELLEKFDKSTSSMIESVLTNQKQNQELTALRDWLLPMLMNGQVTVK